MAPTRVSSDTIDLPVSWIANNTVPNVEEYSVIVREVDNPQEVVVLNAVGYLATPHSQ
jgi:hypothetical protein